MVEIRLRKGPSGPFTGGESGGAVLFAQSIPFGVFGVDDVTNDNTVEQTVPVYLAPVPVLPPGVDWSVIANPSNVHVEGIPPAPPPWMDDWSHSHVRLAEVNVDMNTIIALTFPPGTLGVLVRLGMSYAKDLVAPVTIIEAPFDIMLLQQIGDSRDAFSPPPS